MRTFKRQGELHCDLKTSPRSAGPAAREYNATSLFDTFLTRTANNYRDLAGEAEFLTTLEHPHIIKLRGMAQAAGFRNGPAGYFLVIDRLSDTLDQRIKQWHGTAPNSAHASKQKGRVTKVLNFVRSSGKKRSSEEGLEVKMEKSDVMDECLHVGKQETPFHQEISRLRSNPLFLLFAAMQIASALMYMHSAGVIFR